MKSLIALFVILMCVACSTQPLTEDEKYERENKETLRLEKYYRDKANCEARGDTMYIHKHSSLSKFGRERPPKWDERYACMSDWELQRMIQELSGGY